MPDANKNDSSDPQPASPSEATPPKSPTGTQSDPASGQAEGTCKVPGTNEIVFVGARVCLDGTWQTCQTDGSFSNTGNPC